MWYRVSVTYLGKVNKVPPQLKEYNSDQSPKMSFKILLIVSGDMMTNKHIVGKHVYTVCL